MSYEARIVLDSVGPWGDRLVTMLLTYPRIIHSELMTHRVFSRNAESSRAIPVKERIARVLADPFIPESFGRNQRGMQAAAPLTDADASYARLLWTDALQAAIQAAQAMADLEVHKQLANRLLEPFSWITVLVSSTAWGCGGMPGNFMALRNNPLAQPEFQRIARMTKDAIEASEPTLLAEGKWHLPFITDEDRAQTTQRTAIQVSVARCARLSYLTHEGVRDLSKDIELYERLAGADPPHASAFEHVARPGMDRALTGNFVRWEQYRCVVGF